VRNQRTSILVECWFPRTGAGRSRPLTRRAARLHRLVRTSPPACGRLHSCADNVASRLIVIVPVHPATTFNGFLAHECPAGNLVAARLDGATGRYAPRERQKVCVRNETRPHRADPGAAPSIGTVWPAHGLTRQLCARFTPLHEPLCRRRGRFAAFRRSQTAETGGKDVLCPGGNSVRAASFRFAALHETVRPHSKNGNGLTPRSSGYAPCYVAPPLFPLPHFARRSAGWPRSQHKPRSRWRDSPDEPRPRKFNIGSADGWHEGTADATLLTSLRGWASALLPGRHTTHIVRLVVPPT
jgi:hypothetical protein